MNEGKKSAFLRINFQFKCSTKSLSKTNARLRYGWHIPAAGNGRLVLFFGFLITAAPLILLSCFMRCCHLNYKVSTRFTVKPFCQIFCSFCRPVNLIMIRYPARYRKHVAGALSTYWHNEEASRQASPSKITWFYCISALFALDFYYCHSDRAACEACPERHQKNFTLVNKNKTVLLTSMKTKRPQAETAQPWSQKM